MSQSSPRRSTRLVGEFILIVVGVLAALAVDQWQTSRGEREQGRQYLERLLSDLDRTHQSITEVAWRYERVLLHGRATLGVLLGQAELPTDTMAFLLSAYVPTRSFGPSVSRATYDDLVSTGNLDLIQPVSLRDSIMSYHELVEDALFGPGYGVDRASYRATVRSLIPLDLQLGLQACDFNQEIDSCRPETAGVSLTAVSDAVLSEPGLARTLTLSLQSSAIRIEARGRNTLDFILGATASLRLLIEATLHR